MHFVFPVEINFLCWYNKFDACTSLPVMVAVLTRDPGLACFVLWAACLEETAAPPGLLDFDFLAWPGSLDR